MRFWIHSPISAALIGLLVLQPVLPGAVAQAAAPSAKTRKASRQAFERAQEAYAAERWDEALAGYREANEWMPNPAFTYNMAQCYRQMGAHDEALAHYQRYLEEVPQAKNRDLVQAHIEDLKTAIAQRPPPEPVLVPSEEALAKLRAQEEEERLAAVPASTPVYQTWWFWTAAAVVAGGVATGVAISQSGGPELPPATLGDISIR